MARTPLFSSTCEFDTRGEAQEFLDMMGFRRLPVKGLVRRYAADEVGDDGEALLTFASSTLMGAEDGTITINLVTYPRKH